MLTKVAGVTYCNEDGTSRASIISSMSEWDEIALVRDPLNEYDSNAVKVCVLKNGELQQIGFLEKSLAATLSPWIRRGAKFDVRIRSCGIYMDKPFCILEILGL